MKVFLSMPMHGKTNEEILSTREFNIQMIKLQMPKYSDAEFIDNFTKPEEIIGDRIKILGDSIMKMADADIVIFLPGWKDSNGCMVEFEVCQRYNKPTFFIQESMYNIMKQTNDTE